jgi:hypothetical protein
MVKCALDNECAIKIQYKEYALHIRLLTRYIEECRSTTVLARTAVYKDQLVKEPIITSN